jgi:hypothetical protein
MNFQANFHTQDSYDVVKNGRFIGRMNVAVPYESKSMRFEVQLTFNEWREHGDVQPFNIVEMPLVAFVFTDGSLKRIFDASGVPIESLYRVRCFKPAY